MDSKEACQVLASESVRDNGFSNMESLGETRRTEPPTCWFCDQGCPGQICSKPCRPLHWCTVCLRRKLVARFPFWTSGSDKVDAIIRDGQKTAMETGEFPEWIDSGQFSDVHHLADGGFGSVHRASWPRPCKTLADLTNHKKYPPFTVVLKTVTAGDGTVSVFLKEVIELYFFLLILVKCQPESQPRVFCTCKAGRHVKTVPWALP
jgi:hypothetical protein